MSYFDPLRAELKNYLKRKDIDAVYSAFLFSEEAHKPQVRQSGEPYITHPVAVAILLAQMRMDPATLMAALLHDVIEDTGVKKQELAQQFGAEVAELVDGVSKLTQIHFESRAEAQAENFRKMFLAMARDVRVILIKLADRLHNMRTLIGLPPEKCRRISKETLEIFAPVAHRLGMHNFVVEFQRLGFQAQHPWRYAVLKKYVDAARGPRKEIMAVIEQSFREALKDAKIKVEAIVAREKELYGIYKKMHDRGVTLSEILDIYGVRIIVTSVDDCYRALGRIHALYKPLPLRFKDYVAIPKANGYQSLHTTLKSPHSEAPIEVQIRTAEMDHVATSGIAAHWLYKSGSSMADEAQLRVRRWVDTVMNLQKNSENSMEFLEHVRIDLFPDEVYVFTPKGAILKLPAGATPVDFAYEVHTDIGNTCMGAKVDRQAVPLSAVLENGQTVEIITSSQAIPMLSWLDFVVTSKAKSNIRHFLKIRHKDEAGDLGRRLLSVVLQEIGAPAQQITKASFDEVLASLQLPSVEALYESIGMGERPAALVARQLLNAHRPGHGDSVFENFSQKPLSIKGAEGLAMQFASCCGPIPGDPVGGFFESGRMIVHRLECHRLKDFHGKSDQFIPLTWAENMAGHFKTVLGVRAQNEPGVLAALALAIAEVDANIEDIRVEPTLDQHIFVSIEVSVRDRAHLAQVMREIHNIRRTNPIQSERLLFGEEP